MFVPPPNDLITDSTIAPLIPSLAPALSRRRKAASVVRCLLSQRQSIPLARLPQDLRIAPAHELAGMRPIDHETLVLVVDEFVAGTEGLGSCFHWGSRMR
jgi:flagellar motor switch protein FliG